MTEKSCDPCAKETLLRALNARTGLEATPVRWRSRPWQGVTFAGTRHDFTLRCRGTGARNWAASVQDGLDYAEFDLGAHCLLDIVMTGRRDGTDWIEVDFEALTMAAD